MAGSTANDNTCPAVLHRADAGCSRLARLVSRVIGLKETPEHYATGARPDNLNLQTAPAV